VERDDIENPISPAFVILPLYSTRGTRSGKSTNATKHVQMKSGINQWNAGGRSRTFGEAYIPVPKIVHDLCPQFFPPQNSEMKILLPGSRRPVSAKLCQQGRKALMTSPNDRLCEWLYRAIDPTYSSTWLRHGPSREPYSYEDLQKIGHDCVRLERMGEKLAFEYSLSFDRIGAFEDWISRFE
jgi:hypothetical protein